MEGLAAGVAVGPLGDGDQRHVAAGCRDDDEGELHQAGHRRLQLRVVHAHRQRDVDDVVALARAVGARPRTPSDAAGQQARPRERSSPVFERVQRRVLAALQRTMKPERDPALEQTNAAGGLWW